MKKQTVLAVAFALPFAVGVAAADETSFHALTGVTAAPMSSDQLASVEGGFLDTCGICTQQNLARITQLNASLASLGVIQTNGSTVIQTNNGNN